MAMDGLLVLACALATAAPPGPVISNPGPQPDGVKKVLAVQFALTQGRELLQKGNARAAIGVLEAQLPYIEGNRAYLRLLRDAYRDHLKTLDFQSQSSEVKKYRDRLAILDHSGADLTRPMTPTAAATAPMTTAAAQPTQPALVARGKNPEDPFAFDNKETATEGSPSKQTIPKETRPNQTNPDIARPSAARSLLAQAEEEYSKKAFARARLLFEQAHQVDQTATIKSRDRWAYCKLHHVVQELNRSGADEAALADLQREVRSALELAPRLDATGKWLLQEIEERKTKVGKEALGTEPVRVRHLERNAQGWDVAETANFCILHRQPKDLVERVAQMAERTRAAMLRKWFGRAEEDWKSRCQVYLHADGKEYSQNTGVPASSPGHSRIETDAERVVSRRVHLRCDHAGMLTGVLPHEITHVVLAGHFGRHPVPRWADEGMAVLAEPGEKIAMHRTNLTRCRQSGQLFSVRALMQLDDYPEARRVGAFYAQSVSLVDFLARERGPVVFAQFLRDALPDRYEAALKKHFNYRSFEELEAAWKQKAFAVAGDDAADRRGRS